MAKNKSPKTGPVSVDIVSDIVCPWCWLGKQYFDAAVKASGRKIEVTWRPYMLDPTVPPEGAPYKVYMKKKFGDAPDSRFTAMREHLEAAAPDAGITFRFSELTVRPNTLRAHMLVRWAQGQELALGSAAKEALFKAYFEDLQDIGNIEVLCGLAKTIGLDSDIVKALLEDNRDADKVGEEIDFFRNLGVSGVPTFIYNGQFAVTGAQPKSVHLDAIKQAAALPVPAPS